MNQLLRRRSLVTLLIAFSMILAACASTGSDDTTTSAATETTVASATETTVASATETTVAAVTTTADPKADWPEEILFGFIPSERQEKLADTVQPYMDYLTENIGITFTGVITADYN
jgi:ABC-type phosphate/phosphonate transport system substrate-binding protein